LATFPVSSGTDRFSSANLVSCDRGLVPAVAEIGGPRNSRIERRMIDPGFPTYLSGNIAMLTAYFDESEYGEKLCVVGGFVSTSEKWVRFSEECERLKSEYSIPYFHSVKLFSPQPSRIYGHLSTERRLELVDALKDAIMKWTEHSVMSTVIPRAYNALTTTEWRNRNDTYYSACFYWILICLEELFDEETVTIFFEAGHKHAGGVENLLRRYKLFCDIDPDVVINRPSPLPLKIGGYGRLTKELAPPLWAADLISYCTAREVARKDSFCCDLGRSIASKVPSFGICIDEEKIEIMKNVSASVAEQNKQFRAEMHEMTKFLHKFGVRAEKDKRGVGFNFEHMTPEQRDRFMEDK
jgi:hypothetical protein